MVFIAPFIGAVAVLSGFVSGMPRPQYSYDGDSGSYGSSSDSAEAQMASQSTTSAYSATMTAPYSAGSTYSSSGSYASGNSGNYDSGNNGNYGSSGYTQTYNAESSSSTITSMSSTTTSTTTSWSAYSTPTYGSGSSNWGNQAYNDCVQQCVASYSTLPAAYTATATNTPAYGTGATHTVVVAPTQGVLRYIPFAVNASVGDTIMFMWGANNHTVTKSSSLLPCNKSADALFASGTQNKGFVFTQVVNDTNPTFFYCATPTHCQKGMFGIINPPSALTSATSVGNMMPGLISNNSNVAAYAAYTANQTVLSPEAAKWGNSIDMGSMPGWAHEYIAENVMYTQTFLAANPEVLQSDGSIKLDSSATTPLMIPQDLTPALLDSASPSAATTAAATSASTTADAAATTASTSPNSQNQSTGGAVAISSSKVLTAFVAILVGFMVI